jgi:hypothetical protein
MRIKLQKSVASAFNLQRKQKLSNGDFLYNNVPLVSLPADHHFQYLGMHASIPARNKRHSQWRPAVSSNLAAEKAHIFSATKELIVVAKQYCNLLAQMMSAMQMVAY